MNKQTMVNPYTGIILITIIIIIIKPNKYYIQDLEQISK